MEITVLPQHHACDSKQRTGCLLNVNTPTTTPAPSRFSSHFDFYLSVYTLAAFAVDKQESVAVSPDANRQSEKGDGSKCWDLGLLNSNILFSSKT